MDMSGERREVRMPFVSVHEHARRLRRRAVTVSALLVLGAVLFASLPLTLPILVLVDLAKPGKSWARCRAFLSVAWIALCQIVGVFAAFGLWVALLVHRNQSRFLLHNVSLQRTWTNALFAGARHLFSMRVESKGLENVKQGPLLFLVRHASLVDTVLTAAILANPHNLHLRYVLKSELLSDPCIDIVGHRLQNAFVSRGAEGKRDIGKIVNLANGLGPSDGVLIYPEGTRFSPQKLRRIQERLADDSVVGGGAAELRHVLPPRPGGTLALLGQLPEVDIVVVSHTGLEGAASLGDFWRGELIGKTLRINVKRISHLDIPPGETAHLDWLIQQWHEMDEWVGLAKALENQNSNR